MESKVLKKTRNVIIGFFALVFIMGFFSKTIINLFLPKVKVVSAEETSVKRSIEVNGEIKPKETLKVRLPGSVIVGEYFKEEGEAVKKGEEVFKINTGYGVKNQYKDISTLSSQLHSKNLELKKINENNYIVDEKNMDLLKAKLEDLNNTLKEQRELYEAGAISKSKVEEVKKDIEKTNKEIDIKKAEIEEKKKEAQIKKAKLQGEIAEIQREMGKVGKMGTFYSNVDNKGIYYSEVDGIVMSVNNLESILPQDEVIVEIAKVEDNNSLKFVGKIDEEDYEFVRGAMFLDVLDDSNKTKYRVQLTKFQKIVKDGKVNIEGKFQKDIEEELIVGKKLKSRAVKRYSFQGEYNTVPKSAVVPSGKFEKGEKGIVYMVEEKEGILGKEYRAKKVDVEIIAVGNDKVILEGLSGYDDPKIITNLSYKITDGVKVFLWN
ncbi:hypothetical protein [Dethiothermospora halolimnae]|uniref:hypothetical protein n=1 Tax=Dethiothermospora halolimnae TaxID=3114390 RepID=UPI003CCBC13E